MADEFDLFLGSALAPPEREPDRQFVARVQARIVLEERLAAQERALLGSLLRELLAVAAVAGALWWISRSEAVAGRVAESPAAALAILLALFMFVVAVLSFRPRIFMNSLAPIRGFSTC
jgi:hypothetical protein